MKLCDKTAHFASFPSRNWGASEIIDAQRGGATCNPVFNDKVECVKKADMRFFASIRLAQSSTSSALQPPCNPRALAMHRLCQRRPIRLNPPHVLARARPRRRHNIRPEQTLAREGFVRAALPRDKKPVESIHGPFVGLPASIFYRRAALSLIFAPFQGRSWICLTTAQKFN